jgi:hypothetical protein
MAKIPSTWDCGPDADEYAGERGEARQAVRRGDEDYSYGRSRHADGPMHFAGLADMSGYREEW